MGKYHNRVESVKVKGAGILFECGDDKQLSEILRKLLSDKGLYHKILSACEHRAAEYDINKMVKAYSRIYQELVHKN